MLTMVHVFSPYGAPAAMYQPMRSSNAQVWPSTYVGATKTRSKSILLSSGHDSEYYRQRTSGLPSSHHRPPFIIRPAICVACACHVAPTLPESPQRSWWGLVLAETRPAHRVTRKVTSRPCLCLGSCGSSIVSWFDGIKINSRHDVMPFS